jgi:hypothetical protein
MIFGFRTLLNNELEIIYEKAVVAYFEVESVISLEGLRQTTKPSVRTVDPRADT